MIRQFSFSFLLSIIIHLTAALIISLLVITPSEKFSDAVQVVWLKTSPPKPLRHRMLQRRMITTQKVLLVQKTSDTLREKVPPVWTAASPETFHGGDRAFLPPMPSSSTTDSLSIPSIGVNFNETKRVPAQIQPLKAFAPSRVEQKGEELPGLSPLCESMTPQIAEPTLQDLLSQQEALSSYLRKVRQKIVRAKKYPEAARSRGIEGIVHLKFILLSNGRVDGIEVAHSSGYETLDQAAILTIKDAAPFPPFPKAIRQESLQIELPLAFKLREPE